MRFPRSGALRRAQSSPLGVALILGITLTAAVAIVVFGTVALEDSQQQSQIGQAEQALTQFDSRAAQVALGDSSAQTVRIGQSGGQYWIDPDAGHVTIAHVNRTGNEEPEVIYDAPLGAVLYQRSDTVIAYQGGGVWRQEVEGGSTMVSPPEFHYRQATLTFPIIRVTGEGSVTGDVSARVTSDGPPRAIFANASDYYEFSPHDNFTNPISEGTMMVTVDSEYCEGWQTYFESRTEGEVTDCDDGRVSADLLTFGTHGEFRLDGGADDVDIVGLDDGHPLDDFGFTFRADSSPGFSNFRWEMVGTDEADNTIAIGFDGRGNPCEDGVEVSVYFKPGDSDTYHVWGIEQEHEDAYVPECGEDEEVLRVDLLDGDRNVTYGTIHEFMHDDVPTGDLNETERFTEHEDADPPDDPDRLYEVDDEESIELVVQHYFGLLEGETTIRLNEQVEGNPANIEESSRGEINYRGGGQVVTFLHVTENEVRVELR